MHRPVCGQLGREGVAQRCTVNMDSQQVQMATTCSSPAEMRGVEMGVTGETEAGSWDLCVPDDLPTQ